MILVFILLGIITFLVIFTIILIFSTFKIEIVNLNLTNIKENNIKDNYKIKLTFYFLKKIPVLWVNLNSKKVKEISKSKVVKNIDFKKIGSKDISNKEILNIFKLIRIKKLDLKLSIGLENAISTSYLVAFLASIIGIILPHLAKENIKHCKYIINPRYTNKNEYYINLNSIISIKIVHIISSMLNLRKRRIKKNERTSNRRSYVCGYE